MRVLIAVDETSESIEAARCAHRLFGPDAAYVIASIGDPSPHLSALDPFGAMALDVRTIPVPSSDHAKTIARCAAQEAGLRGAAVVAEVGLPGPALCKLAAELGADALVVGDHDRGFLSRLLDRSVTRYVADHAPCPVLIARSASTKEDEE